MHDCHANLKLMMPACIITIVQCNPYIMQASKKASLGVTVAEGGSKMRTEMPLYEDVSKAATPTKIKTTLNEAYGSVN